MIRAWVKLVRLPNALTAGLGVALGYVCLPGPMDQAAAVQALQGFAAMCLLAAAGNVQNDVLDLAADLINRPDRPLPRGVISRKTALRASILLYAAALAISAWVGLEKAALTFGMAVLLCAYNFKLKALPLWGNLAVAALCALAIYFPEFPAAPIHTGLPFLFAFLTTAAREIVKDAEDVPGDRASGWSTFPIRYGFGAAKTIVVFLTLLVLILLPLPYLLLGYHTGYVILAALGPFLLLLSILRGLSRPITDWSAIQKRWKWTMLAGMAAIFVGVYP